MTAILQMQRNEELPVDRRVVLGMTDSLRCLIEIGHQAIGGVTYVLNTPIRYEDSVHIQVSRPFHEMICGKLGKSVGEGVGLVYALIGALIFYISTKGSRL